MLVPALALAVAAAAAPSPAEADVWWTLKDSATTTAGTPLGAYAYDEAFINTAFGDTITYEWSASPDTRSLALTFEYDLGVAIADNPIVSAASFECAGYTCPNATETRYIVTGGYATAPEAPTWPMMILGVGLLACGPSLLRRGLRRRAA